jgi:HD-like signal output (HDOD) protein
MNESSQPKFRVKCPHCGEMFVVKLPTADSPPAAAAPIEPPVVPKAAVVPPDFDSLPPEPEPDFEDWSPEEEAFREQVIKHILARNFELPMLPHVALKVLRITNDPDTSVQDLAKVILTDQTIATKIVQIANSPVYAGAVEVKNINMALVRLGQNEIKNLMLAISLQAKIFKSKTFGALARSFWERAVGVAFASRVLAHALKADKDEAFLCGLMHNLGRMISLNIIESSRGHGEDEFRPSVPLVESIIEQYHQDIGQLIVEKWTLPALVRQVVTFYERPEEQEYPEPIVSIVAVGEQFCRKAGIGNEPEEELMTPGGPAAQMLRIDAGTGQDLYEHFVRVYQSAQGEFL